MAEAMSSSCHRYHIAVASALPPNSLTSAAMDDNIWMTTIFYILSQWIYSVVRKAVSET